MKSTEVGAEEPRDYPGVDLPSREELQKAIAPWWQGGGTAEVLVDLLRRESAELGEARTLAKAIADIADRGYKPTPVVIASTFADQRSAGLRKTLGKGKATPSRRFTGLSRDPAKGWVWSWGASPSATDFDEARCVFADGVSCPQCSALEGKRIVHGHLLSPEELGPRFVEVRKLLAARLEEASDAKG